MILPVHVYNVPVKVNAEGRGQVSLQILTVCLQGTLTTAILFDINLSLKMVDNRSFGRGF